MRIPVSTYRLQFRKEYDFAAATAIVPYLAELGISDLYASPIFKARAGSSHGYDVVDPTQLNPELGTHEDFDALVSATQQHQMGWLQDIVPNHMAYDSQNLWLMDVLENGFDSDSFDYFDIDWNHAYEDIRGRILAPLLGNLYSDCLENGEIKLAYDETGLSVNYFGLRLPVRIESYARFITYNLGQLTKSLGRRHPDFVKLLGILYLLKNIPTEAKGRERYDQVAFVKGLLWELHEQNEAVRELFVANVQSFNGEVGNSESFNLLDSLLSEQLYRLSFWKVGAEEINYRRFFTVNELISVKVEEIKVFHKTHSLITQLTEDGIFTGLRIDHIDGLYNPAEYLERLREKIGDVYITVEKILELTEALPTSWQIQGTSGYEFLNYVNGLFCNTANEAAFNHFYITFTGVSADYDRLSAEKKWLIIDKNLAGDVENLAQRLKRIAAQTRSGGDFTAYGLKRALSEVLALFPIYRTYVASNTVSDTDRRVVQETIALAKQHLPLLVRELEYLETILLREDSEHLADDQKAERLGFVMRMQQLTGPLMAKGIEDTLLYVYNRLLSLNEVGGNPSHFGISPTQFHEFNQRKVQQWLHSMNTTSTHDTKRGEDARARLNVLSEIPDAWAEQVKHWAELNFSQKVRTGGRTIPDRNDEYFLYQTLVGSLPFADAEFPEFVDRVKDYVIKAVREAKVHTAWLRPDSDYERGFSTFVETLLATPENDFLSQFRPFQATIAEYGIFNSLSQVLIKNAAPGVPDLYQGDEFWNLSFVDPDNRRPVAYDQRSAALMQIQANVLHDPLALIDDLFTNRTNGNIKLFLTYQLLQARKNFAALFQQGDYQPLTVDGVLQNHIVAFARTFEGQVAIAIAPRFLTSLIQPGERPLGVDVWHDTHIIVPSNFPSTWTNAVTNQSIHTQGTIAVSEALQHFPVALLVGG
ncbi:MAG: malto-oligosyltrehalose synthase [Tildeniella nuda ZEHNDER 1965/U140]|jgi:(1->4)-alpha-D-glucan 1-alpha-D-glucosylmutase|nr:malto-oligosyltrehalose synthase [Tildeniella nuda ZEHNDER 1965/U140]